MPDAVQVQAHPPINWGPVRYAPLLFIAISNILKQSHPLLIPVINNEMQRFETMSRGCKSLLTVETNMYTILSHKI